MSILHIDSSILGGNSASRSLTAAIVAQLTASGAAGPVIYRDLAAHPIPHLSGAYLGAAAAGTEGQHDAATQADLALGAAVIEELLAADIIVIGAGLYNFSVPSQLKAWIDRIAVAGKTFRYTEKGPEGLLGHKRVILAIARGGYYGAGTPAASFEHGETYLRSVFAFLGVTNLDVIIAEGLAVGPEQREAGTKAATTAIAGLKVA